MPDPRMRVLRRPDAVAAGETDDAPSANPSSCRASSAEIMA
jgi:hypothetical protein